MKPKNLLRESWIRLGFFVEALFKVITSFVRQRYNGIPINWKLQNQIERREEGQTIDKVDSRLL